MFNKKNTPVCLSSLELLSNTIFGMRLHITQHKKYYFLYCLPKQKKIIKQIEKITLLRVTESILKRVTF